MARLQKPLQSSSRPICIVNSDIDRGSAILWEHQYTLFYKHTSYSTSTAGVWDCMSTSCIPTLNVHFSATPGGALVSLTLIDLSIQHNRTQLQDCRNRFSSKTFSKLDILELLLQDMMMMMVIMMIMCIYFIYLFIYNFCHCF